MCKEGRNQDKEPQKLTREQASEGLKKLNATLETNPYLPSISAPHNLNAVWRKALSS